MGPLRRHGQGLLWPTLSQKGGDTLSKNTSVSRVLSALKRASKKGVTVNELASRTGYSPATVTKALTVSDEVAIIGTRKTGQRGRPASLYIFTQ